MDEQKGFCSTCEVPKSLGDEFNFLGTYMSLPMEERSKIGHMFKDLIKECTFRGRDCLHNRFVITLFTRQHL